MILDWITNNWIEVFGVLTGIIYVILEIKQNLWLWPLGILTSAVYILIFFNGKFYADMCLQVYYLAISCLGLYWWAKGGHSAKAGKPVDDCSEEKIKDGEGADTELHVTRVRLKTCAALAVVFVFLYAIMWFVLSNLTDSPVPEWDSFITSLSIIATWMLARKILEHWYLWMVVNCASTILFVLRGLYPTAFLYIVYFIMSFAGLKEWKRSIS